MKLAYIDLLATSGQGRLHSISTTIKISAGVVLLVGIIISQSLLSIGIFGLFLLLLLFWASLPFARLLSMATYPTFFSLPFALAQLQTSPALAVVVPLRAASSALVLLILISTTPYPLLLAVISRVLPAFLVDAIFLTYRMFFLLVGTLDRLLLSMRLRGALSWRNCWFSIRATVSVLGLMFVQTISMGERLHQAYTLRGYKGQIVCAERPKKLILRECLGLAVLSGLTMGVSLLG